MNYISVCSGIEAATSAWHPLGWTPFGFAEIEAFPSALLSHHYGSNLPGEAWSGNAPPNFGDLNNFKDWPHATLDALVGGTPCQSFSVAGLRKGLADPRGNLCLTFLALADKYRPKWVLWENVPGVLSSDEGRDFGAFLGGLGQLGYGWAYRVLDAQYVRVDGFARAVPQRRRRVFVVGCAGGWQRAAAVLFERESLQGNPAPRREARKGVAPTLSARAQGGGGLGTDFDCNGGLIASTGDVAHCLNAGGMGRIDYESETMVAHSLRAEGFDASEDGTGRGTPIIPIDMRQASRGDKMTNNRPGGSSGGAAGTGIGKIGDPAPSLSISHTPAIAFDCKASGRNGFGVGEISPTLRSMNSTANSHPNAGGQVAVQQGWAVRRLTPLECERLQGFPDHYTAVPYRGKPAADGPRYKALGNSMAVNVMRWIGTRIALVDALH